MLNEVYDQQSFNSLSSLEDASAGMRRAHKLDVANVRLQPVFSKHELCETWGVSSSFTDTGTFAMGRYPYKPQRRMAACGNIRPGHRQLPLDRSLQRCCA
jgi:hypothetical protein